MRYWRAARTRKRYVSIGWGRVSCTHGWLQMEPTCVTGGDDETLCTGWLLGPCGGLADVAATCLPLPGLKTRVKFH